MGAHRTKRLLAVCSARTFRMKAKRLDGHVVMHPSHYVFLHVLDKGGQASHLNLEPHVQLSF